MDWTNSTACTRPGGIVWDWTWNRPELIRSPSGESATVKSVVAGELGEHDQQRHAADQQEEDPAGPAVMAVTTTTTTVSASSTTVDPRSSSETIRSLVRNSDQRALWRLAAVRVQAGRPCDDLVAQALGVGQRQVADLGARIPDTGDLDGHLCHAEEPREQGLDDFDALQPRQLQPALPLGQDTRCHPEVAFVVEPVQESLPGQELKPAVSGREHRATPTMAEERGQRPGTSTRADPAGRFPR